MKDRRLLQDLGCAFMVILVYLILHITGIGCPIRFMTGISCMGCGMTRAWISVIMLRFQDAFSYHPLWPLPALWVAALYFRGFLDRINKYLFRGFSIACIAAFTVVYIMRITDPSDTVVVFDPTNGFIYKALHFIPSLKP